MSGHWSKNDRISNEEKRASSRDRTPSNLRIAFNTGLAYSANIGGVGTLIGSGVQLVMLDIVEGHGCCSDSSKAYNIANRKNDKNGKGDVAAGIRKEYDDLGPMKWAEIIILIMFMVLILAWFFEEPRFIPGWKIIFKEGYVTATCIALTLAILCFILPASGPSCQDFGGTAKPYKPMLEWGYAQQNVNWGILLFIGGIQTLSQTVNETGLAAIIGEQFEVVGDWPAWLVLVFLSTASTVLTEVTSGAIIMTVLMPVIQTVALANGVHPWYFIISTTLGMNLCFCLPAGNVINAMVIANNDVTIPSMFIKLNVYSVRTIKSGLLMNVLCLAVNNIAMNTYGRLVLQLDTIPEWAMAPNVSTPHFTMELTTVL
ncbi:Na(+)/citrate cotransporter-like [Glandiceps talaboti]